MKNEVRKRAKKIRGKDPKKYRQDPYGNEMAYSEYGRTSKKGYQIDQIRPVARGGSNHIRNLQALNTKINREKGDSLVKKSRHSQA
jgi:hypothetical protein